MDLTVHRERQVINKKDGIRDCSPYPSSPPGQINESGNSERIGGMDHIIICDGNVDSCDE